MAIRGLTDRDQADTLHLGYPRIATLFKGDPKPDPKRPGKDRETFRVVFEKPYNTPEIQAAWERIYGAEPVSLDWVFLFGNTPEEVFPTWLEEWSKTAMLHRCDGETQVRHYVKETAGYSNAPAPCVCSALPKPKCQRVGRLSLWLPLFIRDTGMKGYVALATHSINDLITLDATIKALFRDYGDISKVPLIFGRKPEQISTPMNGERATTTKSLLYLQVMPHHVQKVIAAALNEGHAGLGLTAGASSAAALPAPKPVEPPPVVIKDAVWTDATRERAATWINRNYGLDAAQVIRLLDKPFEDFETVEAWQGAVKAFLMGSELPMIARAIEVQGNDMITGFKVVTTLMAIQVTGGASALERLWGEDRDVFVDRYAPMDWNPNGKYDFNPPVWVMWKLQEGERIATGLSFNPPRLPEQAAQDEMIEGDFEEVERE